MKKHTYRALVKEYANSIYYMLQCGLERRKVRDLLYNQKEKHKVLGISEETLDTIWESIMEGTFDFEERLVIKKHTLEELK